MYADSCSFPPTLLCRESLAGFLSFGPLCSAAQFDSLFCRYILCCCLVVVMSLHIGELCLLAHTLLQQVYSILVTEGKELLRLRP